MAHQHAELLEIVVLEIGYHFEVDRIGLEGLGIVFYLADGSGAATCSAKE